MNPLKNKIFCGGNLEVVSPWPSNFISAIVCDPPYGLEFMGKEWDRGLPGVRFWREFLRITKPGGFLLCFGGTRTYHRLACAIEDAGWEIRDCMMWLYGSGFPKSHNISKAIDKAAGAKRKDTGIIDDNTKGRYKGIGGFDGINKNNAKGTRERNITAPATSLAEVWDGYGTTLKPAWEPIIVAMKPLDGTFAHNAEAHGVAGLNINAGRIKTEEDMSRKLGKTTISESGWKSSKRSEVAGLGDGRWPANLILDEEVGKDESWKRYFYCAKCSKKERNMGLEGIKKSFRKTMDGGMYEKNGKDARGSLCQNSHPTVKPLALMKYLCTLLKMPGQDRVILDPFLGSGTTGMACKELGINFIGIEKEPEYCEIAVKRIAAVPGQEISLYSETPKSTPSENLPHLSESRQKLINAASAALRRNQK